MTIRILYFAAVRDAIGLDGETISLPEGVTTVADLVEWLEARGGGYATAFDRGRLRAAVDQTFTPLETDLRDATEIALFPPVTGG